MVHHSCCCLQIRATRCCGCWLVVLYLVVFCVVGLFLLMKDLFQEEVPAEQDVA
jgi:hypothetical protein